MQRSTHSNTRELRSGASPLPSILLHPQRSKEDVMLLALTLLSKAESMESVRAFPFLGCRSKLIWTHKVVHSAVMRFKRIRLHLASCSLSDSSENSSTLVKSSTGSCSTLLAAAYLRWLRVSGNAIMMMRAPRGIRVRKKSEQKSHSLKVILQYDMSDRSRANSHVPL